MSSTSKLRRSVLAALAGLLLSACAHAIPASGTPCDAEDMLDIAASNFTPGPDQQPAQIAADLANCLGSPDPALRDDIAYTGLVTLLRAGALDDTAKRNLMGDMLANLGTDDINGFLHPFSALVLAEVARTDRVAPWMTETERLQMLDAAVTYVTSVSDYRGFDEVAGWRHGVAHGADWLMQLSLNPAYEREDHLGIVAAVASQARTDTHAYVRGEGERLARPILFVFRRGTLTAEDWQSWLAALVNPAPLESWDAAFKSTAALNRLHNLKNFLYPLALQVPLDGPEAMTGLAEAIAGLP